MILLNEASRHSYPTDWGSLFLLFILVVGLFIYFTRSQIPLAVRFREKFKKWHRPIRDLFYTVLLALGIFLAGGLFPLILPAVAISWVFGLLISCLALAGAYLVVISLSELSKELYAFMDFYEVLSEKIHERVAIGSLLAVSCLMIFAGIYAYCKYPVVKATLFSDWIEKLNAVLVSAYVPGALIFVGIGVLCAMYVIKRRAHGRTANK
jgi:MFS family permease